MLRSPSLEGGRDSDGHCHPRLRRPSGGMARVSEVSKQVSQGASESASQRMSAAASEGGREGVSE